MVHHSDALTRESGDASLAEAVVSGDHEVLDARLCALLDYAVALTVDPHAVRRQAVERLQRAGLSARDVIDANQVSAYFNDVNRIAEGLGVELEDDWPDDVAAPRAYGLRERYLSKDPRDG